MFRSKIVRPRFLGMTGIAFVLAGLNDAAVRGGVTLVEPGHTLTQLVDSAFPLHPSQPALDAACAFGNQGNIESIGIDPATGTLYVQLSPGGFSSANTCVFSVAGPVVTLVNPSTGFGINSRGTDLHVDPITGLLVTQDQNVSPARIATIVPLFPGLVGTYSFLSPPIFSSGTFGMGFSAGAGGSDVPSGDIVFTSDVLANGIHSAFFGGGATTSHVTPPVGGDDMVIQPDGDWVHVPDFDGVITAYSPAPPHVATLSPTGLNVFGMFVEVGLPFVFGTRATVCDTTGDLYVSYSGGIGGSGIFRVDETLTTATLVLTITGDEGLHDLTLGPSSVGAGESVYFTVHDQASGGEEVWEVTVPECCPGAVVDLDIKPGSCPNSFNRNSNGVLPVALTGSETFDVALVNLATVQLSRADGVGASVAPHEGPPGPHTVIDDVATPFNGELCDCHEEAGDGFADLSMKFQSELVVSALELDDLAPGALVELTLTGTTLDGTAFQVNDCIRLVPPGTPPGMMTASSNLPGIWLDAAPLDSHFDGGGFTFFSRTYPLSTEVTVSAPLYPANHPGWILDRWFINWIPVPAGATTVMFPVDMEHHSIVLIYRELPPTDLERLRQADNGSRVGSPDPAE